MRVKLIEPKQINNFEVRLATLGTAINITATLTSGP